MGNSQSKPAETPSAEAVVDVPRRTQNRLSKPRTNTSTSLLLNSSAPPAASRRNSQSVVLLEASEKRQSFVTPENAVVESAASSRRNSLSTRQRLRDHLFRSKSSDGRSRAWSLTAREDVVQVVPIDRWSHVEYDGKIRGIESSIVPELESKQTLTRPTSRRGSTAYTPYSHHASRLSLVAEAHTPEPNMDEANRKLEQLSERTHSDRSDSDLSAIIPIRRRSMLMTPGVATRRDSKGDLLYEAFPVSRRLSAAGTSSVGSRRSSWFDAGNPVLSSFAELPDLSPVTFLQAPAPNDDVPRAVTPCEQVGHLGAYKLGSLRITNADSTDHDDDGPKDLSIKIPVTSLRTQIIRETSESPTKALELAQEYQQELETLSPFSFENSRTPSPQLETTSKNTAVEDQLFEDDLPEVAIGSPEHALRILDGIASATSTKPSFERSQTSPERVSNSYGSLNNTMQGSNELSYKPLTKNDSGYSSNVSLRSFKAQAEARAVAAKTGKADATEESSKRESETPRPSKGAESPPSVQNQAISLATSNAAPQVPEKSLDRMGAAHTSQHQAVDTSKHWTFRSSLSRKTSNSSPVDTSSSPNPTSTRPAVSLLRRLTKNRPAGQPVVAVTANRNVDSELIPPVSANASAQLELRQKDCPTLSHTYKSTSRTNSRDTLTTILSTTEADTPVDQRSPAKAGRLSLWPRSQIRDDQIYTQLARPSTADEAVKPKAVPWCTLKETQAQIDFETHITSFGSVSESLGASPYDVAVSAMTPRKRSQSFQHSPDGFSNFNRSYSANDLAPHNIRAPISRIRQGMSAETAARMARQKSQDVEIGRRMSREELHDDRSALPSNNKIAERASMTSNNPPMRSPHAHRRNSSIPKNLRVAPPPPVTMSAYRKSLPVQALTPRIPAPRPTFSTPSQGPAVSSTYPQPGPWVPQRPQITQRQSINNAIRPTSELHLNNVHHPQNTRPSLENLREFPLINRNPKQPSPPNRNYSAPINPNSSPFTTAPPPPKSIKRTSAVPPAAMDRYSGGLSHGYGGYALGASAGTRNTWTLGNKMEAGPALKYGVDFGDVPVMMSRVRQEA